MTQQGVQLPKIDEQKSLSHEQQHEIKIPVASQTHSKPCPDLVNEGARTEYIEIAIPLYEASIRGDWKAAKEILDKKPDLVRYSITENDETALHVAASAKSTKQVEEFVENLVTRMEKKDLELENKNSNTALCLAAAAGNVKTVKILVEKNIALVEITGSQRMTPLYMAALFGKYEVAKYLYDNSKKLRGDCWTPQNRGWLLVKCVENDMFGANLAKIESPTPIDIALEILKDHPTLCSNGQALGALAPKADVFAETESNIIVRTINSVWTCIRPTVGPSKKESKANALELLTIIWKNIAEKPKSEIDAILRGIPDPPSMPDEKRPSDKEDQTLQLLKQISRNTAAAKGPVESGNPIKEHTSTAKGPVESGNPIKEHTSTAKGPVESGNPIKEHTSTAKGPVESGNPIKEHTSTAKGPVESGNPIKEHTSTAKGPVESGNPIKEHTSTAKGPVESRNPIKEHTSTAKGPVESKNPIKEHTSTPKFSSRMLFIAAKMGNTRFVIELIRLYPDLIWKINDNGKSIFHIAIKHRHEGIYNILYEIGSMKDLITPMKDHKLNNMLHLVGKDTKKKRLNDVSGVAFQMQRELLWFKEVQEMIPPSYRERKNKDGLTPHQLFTKEHKELVKEGKEWMINTASQCMVVAALIATIVFAAAFTVPGGYNQNNGIPIFYRKVTFKVFVVADALSLFSSSTSILMFLSILTSRYAEHDFLYSLPEKLMLGLATLFLSITTMMIAFSVSFFVLYHRDLKWIPILITLFATMPVLLFAKLQFPLLKDVFYSTYASRYLFRPKKHLLYYENSKSNNRWFPFTIPFISRCTSKFA